jgi:hypothetical protein
VAGFEVRYFGTLFPNFDYVSGGLTLIGAKNCIVSGCHVHTIGGRNIFLRSRAADNLIENNLVRDPRIGGWPWSTVKSTPDQELTAISNRAGRGNVIRFNTMIGTFNGADGRLLVGGTDEDGRGCDIHDNMKQTATVRGDRRSIGHQRSDYLIAWTTSAGLIAPVYQGRNTSSTTRSISTRARSSAQQRHRPCLALPQHRLQHHRGQPGASAGGPFGNDHYNNILASTGTVISDPGRESPGTTSTGTCCGRPMAPLFSNGTAPRTPASRCCARTPASSWSDSPAIPSS